jgi:hypothetical protein
VLAFGQPLGEEILGHDDQCAAPPALGASAIRPRRVRTFYADVAAESTVNDPALTLRRIRSRAAPSTDAARRRPEDTREACSPSPQIL